MEDKDTMTTTPRSQPHRQKPTAVDDRQHKWSNGAMTISYSSDQYGVAEVHVSVLSQLLISGGWQPVGNTDVAQ